MKQLVLLSLVFLTTIIACKQEVQVPKVLQITDNEVVIEGAENIVLEELKETGNTVFFLVRHTEKRVGDNPELTKEGIERAKRCALIFENCSLEAIFSTHTKRTRATVAPIAEMKNLDIINYSVENQENLIISILEHGPEKNYLIVGHSNTIPSLLNLFGGNEVYENIDESIYDDLFVVKMKKPGDAEIFALKY